MTFQPGDEVMVRRGDVDQRYPEGLYGVMRLAAEVLHLPGIVLPSGRDTPLGHHVVHFHFTLTYTEMTIPSQDLMFVSRNVLV